jgi:hypothetical protein
MTLSSITSLAPQAVDQIGQLQQVASAEGRAALRQHDDWIGRRHAGPAGWQRNQLPLFIMEVDAVFSPVVPVSQQCELPAILRMEGMRDPEDLLATVPIGCIRQLGPRGRSKMV